MKIKDNINHRAQMVLSARLHEALREMAAPGGHSIDFELNGAASNNSDEVSHTYVYCQGDDHSPVREICIEPAYEPEDLEEFEIGQNLDTPLDLEEEAVLEIDFNDRVGFKLTAPNRCRFDFRFGSYANAEAENASEERLEKLVELMVDFLVHDQEPSVEDLAFVSLNSGEA